MGVEEITLLKSKFDLEQVYLDEKCVNRKAAERAIEIASEPQREGVSRGREGEKEGLREGSFPNQASGRGQARRPRL